MCAPQSRKPSMYPKVSSQGRSGMIQDTFLRAASFGREDLLDRKAKKMIADEPPMDEPVRTNSVSRSVSEPSMRRAVRSKRSRMRINRG